MFDIQLGKLLTMTVQLAMSFSSLLVEYQNLISLYQRRNDFAYDLCSFNRRRTYLNFTVGIDQQHFVELYRCPTFRMTHVVNK